MLDDAFKDIFRNTDRNNGLRSQVLKAFISGVMTDDERAALYGLPEGCRMRENAKIISPENLVIGKHCWIGESAILDASGGLEIGEHTSIGLSVYVWSHTSFMANILMDNRVGSPYIVRTKTRIGSGCFIAGHSVVYSGVNIGDRTVLMPMSVVTKDLPGNCIAAGSPAKVIKEIDDDFIRTQFANFKEKGLVPESLELPPQYRQSGPLETGEQ